MRKFHSKTVLGVTINYFRPSDPEDSNSCEVMMVDAIGENLIHTLEVPLKYDPRNETQIPHKLKQGDLISIEEAEYDDLHYLSLLQTNPQVRSIMEVFMCTNVPTFVYADKKDPRPKELEAEDNEQVFVKQGMQSHHPESGTEFLGLNVVIHDFGRMDTGRVWDVLDELKQLGIIESVLIRIGVEQRLRHAYALTGEWIQEDDDQYFLVKDLGKREKLRTLLKLLPLVKTPKGEVNNNV